MPRPSWRRYSTYPPASVIRSTASRSCGPQSQRWLPNTSPVRHSLCGRISGTASPAGAPAQSPSANARCSRPSTSPSKLTTRAVVAYPSANRRGRSTCVRIVAVGGRNAIRSSLAVLEAGREGVPEKNDIADLADVDERRPTPDVPGEAPVAHEPRGLRVADEHRRDHQLQLVDEALAEELRVHRAAALDHQPLDSSRGEIVAERLHLHRFAAVDDGRDGTQTLARLRHP